MTINKSESFAIILSIFIGIIIFFSRVGYINFEKEIFLTILLTSSIIILPKNLSSYFVNKYNLNLELIFPLKIISIFIFILILYFFSLSFKLFFPMIIIGSITAFIFFKEFNNYFLKNFFFLIISSIFAFWIVVAFYSNRYSHPLSYEQLSVGAIFHRDIIWHSAIAGMIKTYNMASIGVDGLLKYNYHIFSNFISAILSSILSVSTFRFYTLLFPIFFVPLFFLFFIEAAIQINNLIFRKFINSDKLPNIFFIFLLVIFSIILPYQFVAEKYQYFQSYSYLVALIILFILVKLSIISYYAVYKKIFSNFSLLILFTLSSILFFLLSISKFSFLYFFIASYTYFFFRLSLYKKNYFNFYFIVLLFISAIVYLYFISTFMTFNQNFGYRHDFESTIQNFYFNFKETSINYYSYLYYSIIFILFRLIYSNINLYEILNYNKCKNLIVSGKFIEIEYLIFLSFALLLFPWQYTNGIQIYIAYLFIFSYFNFFYISFHKLNNLKKIVLSLCVLFFLTSSFINFAKISISYFSHNLTIRQSFANENNVKVDVDNDGIGDFVNKGIREGSEIFYEKFYENRKDIIFFNINKIISKNYINPYKSEFNKEYKLLFFLENLIEKLNIDNSKTALFIPSKFSFFWNISCDTQVAPLIAPGIANLTIIDGLPNINERSCYGLKRSYGFNRYYISREENKSQRIFKEKDTNLICQYALNKSLSNVIILDMKNEEFVGNLLKCK